MRGLRLALRRHGRPPGFTATVVATLALGIGLAAAVLTVADALLLRRLPVADQDRLVVLAGETADRGVDRVPLGLDAARAFARGSPALTRVAVLHFEGAAPVTVREHGRIVRLRRALVSGDFFTALGAEPLPGHAPRPEDDAAGAAAVLPTRASTRIAPATALRTD